MTFAMGGCMGFQPFNMFFANLGIEISHFDIEVGRDNYMVRFNLHQHEDLTEMLGIKCIETDMQEFLLAHSYSFVEFPP